MTRDGLSCSPFDAGCHACRPRFQRLLPWNLVVEASYVGSRTTRMRIARAYNELSLQNLALGDATQGRGASLSRYFNVDSFRPVTRALGIGTSPIGVVRGPGVNNFDVSLFKSIAPREGMRLQLGAEFFNLFNHSQFEALGLSTGAPAFGAVTDARDPRVIQFRARVSF